MNPTTQFASDILGFLWYTGWQAALLIPLVLCIQLLLRNHISPTTKHALWALVFIRLTFPTLPESSFSAYNLLQRDQPTPPVKTITEPRQSVPLVFNHRAEPIQKSHSITTGLSLPNNRENPSSRVLTADAGEGISTSAAVKEGSLPTPVQPTIKTNSETPLLPINPGPTWQQIAAAIWFIGAIILAVRILTHWLRFHRQLKRNTPTSPHPQFEYIATLCQTLGYRQNLRIQVTESVHSPAIYGFLNPTLLLPKKSLQQFDESELRHILAHEVAHLKRLDPVWNLWAAFIQVIHWPNPFVWFAVARLRGDRELATDYLALKKLSPSDSGTYGETILKALKSISRPAYIPGLLGIAEDRRCLRRRFKMIAQFNHHKSYPGLLVLALSLSVIVTSLTDPTPNETTQLVRINARPEATKYHQIKVSVVDDKTDTPLPDVLITATPNFYDGAIFVPETYGRTDQQGIVTLQIPITSSNRLRLTLFASSLTGHVAQTKVWRILERTGNSLPYEHQFRLRKGRAIGGTILNADGQPAKGLEIFVSGSSAHPPYYDDVTNHEHTFAPFELGLKTDHEGRWSFTTSKDVAYLNIYCREATGALARYSTGTPLGKTLIQKDGENIIMGSLLDQSSSITLPKGFDVALRIVNTHQQPIHGATVKELREIRWDGTMMQASSDRRGHITFPGRLQRELLYLVEHPDYASATRTITPSTQQEVPVEISLSPKTPLTGQIIDKEGKPVSNAVIRYTHALRDRFFTWTANSDNDGRFTWENAPTSEVYLEVTAKENQRQYFYLPADQRSATLQILPMREFRTTLNANVFDSATGQPINQFQYSILASPMDGISPRIEGNNGTITLEHSLQELQARIRNTGTQRYRIAVSAPGYESLSSREIHFFEPNVRLEFALSAIAKNQALERFQVQTPTGQPATNARAYLIGNNLLSIPRFNLNEQTTDLQAQLVDGTALVCDENGTLPPSILPEGFAGIYLASNQGSLALTREEITQAPPQIVLQPHGSITGRLVIAGNPISDRTVRLSAEWDGVPLYRLDATSKTGANGEFKFENIPAGSYRLSLYPTEKPRGHVYEIYQQRVDLIAGKNEYVDYTHNGRQVTGQLEPKTYPESIDWSLGSYYLKKLSDKPSHSNAYFARQFVSAPGLQQAVRNNYIRHLSRSQPLLKNYAFEIEDGRFTLPAVEPGSYRLELHFPVPGEWRGPWWRSNRLWLHRTFHVNVPNGSVDTPVELTALDVDVSKARNQPVPKASTRSRPTSTSALPEHSDGRRMMEVAAFDLQTGRPIANAIVTAKQSFPENTSPSQATPQSATTDTTGTTTIRQLSRQATITRIETRAKGYAPAAHLLRDRPLPEHFAVRLERARSLSGRVVTQSGDPIPGVKITTSFEGQGIANRSPYDSKPIITGEDGRWESIEAPISADQVTVYVQHPFMALGPRVPSQRLANRGNHVRFDLDASSDELPQITMVPGGVVSGQVLDEQGNPIDGAYIGGWNLSFSNRVTNSEGRFRFPGALIGEHDLVIEADGYAPYIENIDIAPNSKPRRIILKKGYQTSFLVLDSEDNPLPDARVLALHWNRTGLPLANNSGSTDSDGHYTTTSAPADAVIYLVSANGHESFKTAPLIPSKAVNTIHLQKALMVRFDVNDASGAVIPEFRIVPGHPTRLPLDANAIEWFPGHARFLNSQTYKTPITFKNSFQPPMDALKEQFVFRIEAHGYEPTVTQVISLDESPHTIQAELHNFDGHRGTIASADGMPLVNQIFRSYQLDENAQIRNGNIIRQHHVGTAQKTDSKGRYQLSSQGIETRLFVASPSGFAYQRITASTKDSDRGIRLSPWGRFRGRLSNDNGPVAHRLLGFRPATNNPLKDLSVEFTDRVRTDENGQFSLNHIPPGGIELIEYLTPDQAAAEAQVISTFVQEPGKTTTLLVSTTH